MDMENKLFGVSLSDQEEKLLNRIDENSDLFKDMLFAPGTTAHDLSAVYASSDGGLTFTHELSDDLLPEQLSCFDYEMFTYHVSDLEDANGMFNEEDQSLTISPASLDDDSVILHEMIHLHEFVLNDLPLYFHDAYLWSIYQSVRSQISELDNMIESHCHLFNGLSLYKEGGLHDLLFLLKSYDLDLKKGYKLGTIFGYGYNESPIS